MTTYCQVCGITDAYSKLKDRIRCFVCQIRYYQRLEREQGVRAVLEEARLMGGGDARTASVPFDILTSAAGNGTARGRRG